MDKLEGWHFDRAADGWRWCYAHPARAEAPKQSDRAFPTLLDCIHDAAKHGYIVDAQRRP